MVIVCHEQEHKVSISVQMHILFYRFRDSMTDYFAFHVYMKHRWWSDLARKFSILYFILISGSRVRFLVAALISFFFSF